MVAPVYSHSGVLCVARHLQTHLGKAFSSDTESGYKVCWRLASSPSTAEKQS